MTENQPTPTWQRINGIYQKIFDGLVEYQRSRGVELFESINTSDIERVLVVRQHPSRKVVGRTETYIGFEGSVGDVANNNYTLVLRRKMGVLQITYNSSYVNIQHIYSSMTLRNFKDDGGKKSISERLRREADFLNLQAETIDASEIYLIETKPQTPGEQLIIQSLVGVDSSILNKNKIHRIARRTISGVDELEKICSELSSGFLWRIVSRE